MIHHEHALPLTHQAEALNLSRGFLYYKATPISAQDLELMRVMDRDRIHTDYPFAGTRMMRDMLRLRGYNVGRRHVGTLMQLMGIEALYRKKRTSKTDPEHEVYPELLRSRVVERPNHVWCADISYIPM